MDDKSWSEMMAERRLRLDSLDLVVRFYKDRRLPLDSTLFDEAEQIAQWVTKRTPAHIKIVAIGDVTRQNPQEDTPMQIHDNEQFDVTVEVDDAKGFQLSGEALTVTSADETVVTVQPGADGVTYTLVAGNPGSTVVTFDAGTDDNGNAVQATEAVDVVPGNVSTIKLTEGTATTQGAAAPAAAPGADPTASQSV